MAEEILRQSKAILRWNGTKRGKTMFSAKAGSLVLTTERLLFLSTGSSALMGGRTGPSIEEGLTRKGSLAVPLRSVASAELTSKFYLLTVGFFDGSGKQAFSTFGEQVAGMPDGPKWVEAISAAAARVQDSG